MEKERYLKQLLDVIRVLRGPELDIARKYLVAFESNHTVNRRKMFQLYKYIKINEIRSFDKLKKRISPNSTDDSFNKLIRRTTEKIQESLIVDVNIRRTGAYSDVFRTKFLIRKKLIQAQVLLGRGLMQRSLSIFNSVIRAASNFELYDELIEALFYKRIALTNTEGYAKAERLSEEIQYYERCRNLLSETKAIARRIEAVNADKSLNKPHSLFQKNLIKKIKVYANETNSVSIKSYYFLMCLDDKSAGLIERIELTEKFIELLKNSPAIYSKGRISYLLNELALLRYKQLSFEDSLQNLEEAMSFAGNKLQSNLDLSITYVKVSVGMGDYSEAIARCDVMLPDERVYSQKYSNSVVMYVKSIAQFGLKQYNEAKVILSQKNEIEKDKEGWNVWIRIMRLLCSIEMLKLNLIDYDIESFRKYVERTSKQYDVRERDKLVLRVLLELDRQDYDFEQTAVEVADELEKLKSTDKKYAWNPDSPELILFHDWFEAKRLNRDYEPNFEVYREAIKLKENSGERTS